VAEVRSPTVRRRELGALLRALRTDAGLTVEAVAEQLLCSPSKVSRMETGQRGASQRDVRDLCDLYGVAGRAERERLMILAREGKQQAWWQTVDWPTRVKTYIGLEADAVAIRDFESDVVPGLLQTEDYARALMSGAVPPLETDLAEQHVQARIRRQAILHRTNPPLFHAIVDEAALHRRVGGEDVMQAQLLRIIDVASLANVTFQVLPYAAGAQPGSDSTFVILDFEAVPVSSTVYVESLAGNLYLEREPDLEAYRAVFDRLSEMSASPADTIDLVENVLHSELGYRPPTQLRRGSR
jgi:transcriptional regulator with XRE-family HTH domain